MWQDTVFVSLLSISLLTVSLNKNLMEIYEQVKWTLNSYSRRETKYFWPQILTVFENEITVAKNQTGYFEHVLLEVLNKTPAPCINTTNRLPPYWDIQNPDYSLKDPFLHYWETFKANGITLATRCRQRLKK